MGTSYVKKQRTIRLPAVTNLHVNQFSGGDITTGSSIYNGIILSYPDGTKYVTQRPSANIVDDPDTINPAVTDNRGRGVFYWSQPGSELYVEGSYVDADYVEGGGTPALYIINGPEIYYGTYNTATTGSSITTGVKKVYAAELGDVLVFLDYENNEMWYINASTPSVVHSMQDVSISGTDFSFLSADNSINSTAEDLSVIKVGDWIEVVDVTDGDNSGTYEVESTSANKIVITALSGTIINEASGAESVTINSYTSLPQNNSKTLAAGLVVLDQTMYVLDTDGQVWGSAIGVAKKWVDALNYITTEREEDSGVFIAKHHDNIVVFGSKTIEFLYNAGNATGSSLSVREDISYNIGCADAQSVWQTGDDIYFLGKNNLGHKMVYKLSNFQIEPISTHGLNSYFSESNFSFIGEGFGTGIHTYYILTTVGVSGDVVPYLTNVYNSATQTWTEWEYSDGTTTNNFPIISTTATQSTPVTLGQFTSGETVQLKDNYSPVDTSDNITMKIRLDNFDNGSRDWKFAHQLRYVGDSLSSSSNITIKWADDNNVTYSSGRTIDISDSKNKLTRLGRFKSRSHEIEYSGSSQIRVEGLDIDITEGTH